MKRRTFLTGTVGTASLLAGCTQAGGWDSETPTGPPPDAVVGCDDRIHLPSGSRFIPDQRDIVVGPLAFVGILGYAPTWEFTSTPAGIKVPISLERDTGLTLVVSESDRDHAALTYEPGSLHSISFADAHHSIRFEACDGQRTAWSGGFIVTDPHCVTLNIWINGEAHPREIIIPVGTENCP